MEKETIVRETMYCANYRPNIGVENVKMYCDDHRPNCRPKTLKQAYLKRVCRRIPFILQGLTIRKYSPELLASVSVDVTRVADAYNGTSQDYPLMYALILFIIKKASDTTLCEAATISTKALLELDELSVAGLTAKLKSLDREDGIGNDGNVCYGYTGIIG